MAKSAGARTLALDLREPREDDDRQIGSVGRRVGPAREQIPSAAAAAAAASDATTPAASPASLATTTESLVYRRIRRQVIARGLARNYKDSKINPDGSSPAAPRVTRKQRQIAIIEEYRQRKAIDDARAKRAKELEVERQRQDELRRFVQPQASPEFLKKASLRRLPEAPQTSGNQLEDAAHLTANDSIVDYAKTASTGAFSPRLDARANTTLTPTTTVDVAVHDAAAMATFAANQRREHTSKIALDKTTAQVLCEMKITKDIMMREHTVEQLYQVNAVLEELSGELQELARKRVKAEAIAHAAAMAAAAGGTSLGGGAGGGAGASPLTAKRSSVSFPAPLRRSDSEKNDKLTAAKEAATREKEMREWDARAAELGDRARQRIAQLERLLGDLQAITIEIVEAIGEWRRYKQPRAVLTNYGVLHRFPWKPKRIANYLVHVDSDLRGLFPSAGLTALLGGNLVYNPLLLSARGLDCLGLGDPSVAHASMTFLTERRDHGERLSHEPHDDELAQSMQSPHHPERSPTNRQTYRHETRRSPHGALAAAVKDVIDPRRFAGLPLGLDADRARRCLEAVREEIAREQQDAERRAQEATRLAAAYNPFESIKSLGGVEETITGVLARSAPRAPELAVQLRHRQQDTTRVQQQLQSQPHSERDERDGGDDDPRSSHPTSNLRLHVNPRKLERFLARRKEATEATTDCEFQDPGARRLNRLPGQVLVRRMNVRRLENQLARKIQVQFQTHRRRVNILRNLTRFLAETRRTAIQIQCAYRRFTAKRRFQRHKLLVEGERRRVAAARRIWYAYRRYRRRMLHRQSMSVEAVAQIQLLKVLQEHHGDLDGGANEAVERYRRVGEERRRQRAEQTHRRRQELLEIETRRHGAARRIQSLYRMFAAKNHAQVLRGERRAHLTAVSVIMIQSTIRKFLRHQERRRQRFRSDLERVNRSATRIQSIYRGYNSRASLLLALDERLRPRDGGAGGGGGGAHLTRFYGEYDDDEDDDDDDSDVDDDEDGDGETGKATTRSPPPTPATPTSRGGGSTRRLPLLKHRSSSLTLSRTGLLDETAAANESSTHDGLHAMLAMATTPSPPKLHLPPIRRQRSSSVTERVVAQPPSSSSTSAANAKRPSFLRQLSQGSSGKIELKLKEGIVGGDLEPAATSSASTGFRPRANSQNRVPI